MLCHRSRIRPVITRNAAWGLALGALLFAGCSGATTGARNVRRDSARLYANGSCDSGDCSAYMRWRKVGTTAWTKGPTLTHIGKVPLTDWYQSATGLSPATDYEYQECGQEPSFGARFVCVGGNSKTTSTAPFTTAFWTAQSTPNPQGDSNQLNAVSCTSATACVAVGSQGLVERWDGATWTIQATPSTGDLFAVSCTSATACTAVGDNGLAERWDGTRWATQSTPAPSVGFSAVSCSSSTSCIAVGRGGGGLAVAEHWNGARWTLQQTPTPSDGAPVILRGVSCTSPSACTAVGLAFVTPIRPIAERWDGTNWTLQAVPSPPSRFPSAGLDAVSCPSATACTAVGLDYASPEAHGNPKGLVERWDGTTWTTQATPSTPEVKAVSCASATACTAVSGNSVEPGAAERWDGTSWSPAPPDQTDHHDITLNGVSCTAAAECAAVGSVYDSYSRQPLAERYSE